MPEVQKVNLEEKLARVRDLWSPAIVGQVNDVHVKLVKLKGEFTWHHHDREDELFFVLEGKLLLDLEGRTVELAPRQGLMVPRGGTGSGYGARYCPSMTWRENPGPCHATARWSPPPPSFCSARM